MEKAPVPYSVEALRIEQPAKLHQSQDALLPGILRKFLYNHPRVVPDESTALGFLEHDLENGQCSVRRDCGVSILERYRPVLDIGWRD